MKKALFLMIAIFLTMTAMAQRNNENTKKDHAVYLELLGGSSLIGVSYDARFNGHTKWGWRAGLSFTYTNKSGYIDTYSEDTRYWAVPVGVNYLIGNHKNSLELGLGASLGIANLHTIDVNVRTEAISEEDYQRYEQDYTLIPDGAMVSYDDNAQRAYLLYFTYNRRSKNTFGYYSFVDIGYRHVANSGFLFRVGLSPAFNFGGKHAISRCFGDEFHNVCLGGYVAFGWAF